MQKVLLIIFMLFIAFPIGAHANGPIDQFLAKTPIYHIPDDDLNVTIGDFIKLLQNITPDADLCWEQYKDDYYILYIITDKPLQGTSETEKIGFKVHGKYAIFDAYMGPTGQEFTKQQVEALSNRFLTPIIVQRAQARQK